MQIRARAALKLFFDAFGGLGTSPALSDQTIAPTSSDGPASLSVPPLPTNGHLEWEELLTQCSTSSFHDPIQCTEKDFEPDALPPPDQETTTTRAKLEEEGANSPPSSRDSLTQAKSRAVHSSEPPRPAPNNPYKTLLRAQHEFPTALFPTLPDDQVVTDGWWLVVPVLVLGKRRPIGEQRDDERLKGRPRLRQRSHFVHSHPGDTFIIIYQCPIHNRGDDKTWVHTYQNFSPKGYVIDTHRLPLGGGGPRPDLKLVAIPKDYKSTPPQTTKKGNPTKEARKQTSNSEEADPPSRPPEQP